MQQRTLMATATAGLILFTAGCAHHPGVESQPGSAQKEQLAERALARHHAWQQQDYAGMLEFLSPARQATWNAEHWAFRAQMRRIDDVSVKAINCHRANACTVTLDVTYNQRTHQSPDWLGQVNRNIEESWVYQDQQWWFVPNR